MECSRKSSTSAKDFEGFCRAIRNETRERLFGDAANASLLLSRQPIRHWLPPIEDQLLPVLELSREIGERPLLRRDNALDLSDGFGAFQRVFLAAEAVNFEAAIVRHHVLKAEMRQPAELQ